MVSSNCFHYKLIKICRNFIFKSLFYWSGSSYVNTPIIRILSNCVRYCSMSLEKNNAKNTNKKSRVRNEQHIPPQYNNGILPMNTEEQKIRFFSKNITPEFHLNTSTEAIERLLLQERGNISFNLFGEAVRIMNMVIDRFKSIDEFISKSFGDNIGVDEATEIIHKYIADENLPTSLEVIWCADILGSAMMCSTNAESCKAHNCVRKYTMLIKPNNENNYLKKLGIKCLMDHEIGTHYMRAYNETLQPWYGDRETYNLCPVNSYKCTRMEEGLACIHTLINSKYPYLGIPALIYYCACMAEYLSFKDLFQHMSKFIVNEEHRWKHCVRVKRCLASQHDYGGYGKDQCYFEGAVTLLRNQGNINFELMMAGKLTPEESKRVSSYAVTDRASIRIPSFMRDTAKYRARVKTIAQLNGIEPLPRQTRDRPGSEPSRIDHRIDQLYKLQLPQTDLTSCPNASWLERGGDTKVGGMQDRLCGCYLFMYGSLKKASEALANGGKVSAMPIIIELDMRHPIII